MVSPFYCVSGTKRNKLIVDDTWLLQEFCIAENVADQNWPCHAIKAMIPFGSWSFRSISSGTLMLIISLAFSANADGRNASSQQRFKFDWFTLLRHRLFCRLVRKMTGFPHYERSCFDLYHGSASDMNQGVVAAEQGLAPEILLWF
jgi:hypothetical protein